MKKLIKLSRNLDVFGTNIELTLKQQKTHKTFFGTFLTFCVIIATFLGSRQIGSDFIVKENPDMLFKEMLFDFSTDVLPQWKNLNLIFSIQDAQTTAELNAKQLILDKVINIQITYIHTDMMQEQLEIDWIDGGMRFSVGTETVTSLMTFQNIVVQVSGATLNKFILTTRFTQYFFRSDNYDNPFESILNNQQFHLANIGSEIIFTHTEISTDRGLVTTDFQSQYNFIYEGTIGLQSSPKYLQNTSYLSISVNNIRHFYNRKYLKIQNLLALIGGLLKSLLVVGKFISKPVTKLSIRSRLLNELFNFAELSSFQQANSSISPDKPGSGSPDPRSKRNPKTLIPQEPKVIENKEQNNQNLKENLRLQVNDKQPENDGLIIKQKLSQPREDALKAANIKRIETQYFDHIPLTNEQIAAKLAQSNVFQIQLQTQIEKNVVSQKSININSKRNLYSNQSSKSKGTFQSPGKMQQMFFQGQTHHPYNTQSNSNHMNPSLLAEQQKKQQDYKKYDTKYDTKNYLSSETSPQTEQTPSNQAQNKQQNASNNYLYNNSDTKKKNFNSKKNSLQTQEMFQISEVPQEQLEYGSRIKQNSSKVKRSGSVFFQQQQATNKNNNMISLQAINNNNSSKFQKQAEQSKQQGGSDEKNRRNSHDKYQRYLEHNQINQKQDLTDDEVQAISTSIQHRVQGMPIEIPKLQPGKKVLGLNQNQQNKEVEDQSDSNQTSNKKRNSITLEVGGELEIQTDNKPPTLVFVDSMSQVLPSNPKIPLMSNQIQTLVNIHGMNTENTKMNENSDKKTNQTDQDRKILSQIQLEEQFPALQKTNTQFVADLIEMRAKIKNKTYKQGENTILLSTNNNNPSNPNDVQSRFSVANGTIIDNRLSVNQNPNQRQSSLLKNQNPGDELNHSMSHRNLKKFDKMIENKQTNTLKLGFLDYIKFFIFKKDKKKTQINYCMKKVKQRLDIVYILNKLVEIDKMKMLLLDHNQRELFEFLPRPVVLQKKNEDINEVNDRYNIQEAWGLLQEEKTTIDKATDACISYKIMTEKKKKNVIDDRLLEMLDINIRHVFDQTAIPNEIIEEKRGLSQAHTNLHNRQNQLFNIHEKKANRSDQILSQALPSPQHPELKKRNTSNKSQKAQKNLNKIKNQHFAQRPTDDLFNAYYDTVHPSGTLNMSHQLDSPIQLNKKQSQKSNNNDRVNRLKDLQALQNHPKNIRQKSERHMSNNSKKINSQDYLSDVISTDSNQKARQPYSNTNEIKHKKFNQSPYKTNTTVNNYSQFQPANNSSFQPSKNSSHHRNSSSFKKNHEAQQELKDDYIIQEEDQQLHQIQQNQLQQLASPSVQNPSMVLYKERESNFSFNPQQTLNLHSFTSNNNNNALQLSINSQNRASIPSTSMVTKQESLMTPPLIGQQTGTFPLSNNLNIVVSSSFFKERLKSPNKKVNNNIESNHSFTDSVAEENNQNNNGFDLPQSNISKKLQSDLPQQMVQQNIQKQSSEQEQQLDELEPIDKIIQKSASLSNQRNNNKSSSKKTNTNNSQEFHFDINRASYKQKIKDHQYHSKSDANNLQTFNFSSSSKSSDEGDIENGVNNNNEIIDSFNKLSKKQESHHQLLSRKRGNTLSKSLELSHSDSSNNSQKQQHHQQPFNGVYLKDNMNLNQYYQIAKPIHYSKFNKK